MPDDPISIPKRFSLKQDIEITAFWTAMLAWGRRATIINKATELIDLMDGAPYDFILNHTEQDRAKFLKFKHRTFQTDDTIYFLHFLQNYYKKNESLESAFVVENIENRVEAGITNFHNLFTGDELMLRRTGKHVSTPARNTACKRLNMFLRWMVRSDEQQVDFGIWKRLSMADLMIPLDVHVSRVARQLGLLTRPQDDWKSVVELTENLRLLDKEDPVRYDYALFSIGVNNGQ
nr:TIGR02757 family protein [Candidatus Brachybacter algidus]